MFSKPLFKNRINHLNRRQKLSHCRLCLYIICIIFFLCPYFKYFTTQIYQVKTQSGNDVTAHPWKGKVLERQYEREMESIFNIRFFISSTPESDYHNEPEQNGLSVAQRYPNSIASYYSEFGISFCERKIRTPFVPALRAAFASYGVSIKSNPIQDLARRNDTLTVQIAGQKEHRNVILQQVRSLASNFSIVLLVPLSNEAWKVETISTLNAEISKIASVQVLEFSNDDPDASAFTLSIARNLFAHGGNAGALAALSNGDGTVYPSTELDPFMQINRFKWMIFRLDERLDSVKGRRSVELMRRLNSIGQIKPSCCHFQGFGKGDQEKVVCTNARNFNEKNCWVLSLGCNNKWLFEKDIYSRTICSVHVFDCTGNFEVPSSIRDRVFLHGICVGSSSNITHFKSLLDLIRIGSDRSGFQDPEAPMIAKIDIEGWEYSSFREFFSNNVPQTLLPHQILMEVHVTSGRMFHGVRKTYPPHFSRHDIVTSLISEYFFNFSRFGYILVHRADNPFCPSCSEISLIHSRYVPNTFQILPVPGKVM